jgi:aminoglycoside phosphotransferase (APT) family kinase protein
VTSARVTRPHTFTNHVLRIAAGNVAVVARVPRWAGRPDVDRAAEAEVLRMADAAGVGAPILHLEEDGVLVTAEVDGHHPTPAELRTPRSIDGLVSVLRGVHGWSARGAPAAEPRVRAERYASMLVGAGRLPAAYERVERGFRSACATAETSLPAVLCHGDLWPGNVLVTSGGFRLLDWEFATHASPLWDLACLSVEAGFDEDQDALLLTSYHGRSAEGLRAPFVAWKAISHVLWGLWALVEQLHGNDAPPLDGYGASRLDRAEATLRTIATAR